MPTSNQRPIPNDILLSFATAPLLLGLLAGKTIAKLVQSASEASEEILRGDRLPFLDTPVDSDRS